MTKPMTKEALKAMNRSELMQFLLAQDEYNNSNIVPSPMAKDEQLMEMALDCLPNTCKGAIMSGITSETKRPILLTANVCVAVHLFSRYSDSVDIHWLSDADNYHESSQDRTRQAASDLIDALQEHHSYRFLECLRDEAQQRMDSWKIRTP